MFWNVYDSDNVKEKKKENDSPHPIATHLNSLHFLLWVNVNNVKKSLFILCYILSSKALYSMWLEPDYWAI